MEKINTTTKLDKLIDITEGLTAQVAYIIWK